MANTRIALKKSPTPGSIPSAGNLANGELAINYADGIIYYKNVAGQVAQISSGEYFGTVNANGTFLTATLPGDIVSILAGQNITISTDAIHNKLTINSDPAPANGWANSVGTAGNNYTNYVGASANAYALALKPDLSPVFVTANAAFNVANSSNGWANAVGTAANNYAYVTYATQTTVTTGLSSVNSWSTTIGLSGNSYAAYVGAAVNNYITSTYSTSASLNTLSNSLDSNWAVTNAAFAAANVAFGDDASNWGVTNAVYTIANNARDSLASNWAVTNAAYTSANGGILAFGSANSLWSVTNASYTVANTARDSLASNWAVTNAAYTVANSSNGWANTVGTAANNYATATYATLGSVASNWAVTNAAYTQANTAINNDASNWAVTNAAYTQANTAINNDASNWAVTNAAYTVANTARDSLASNWAVTNAAYTVANSSNGWANTISVSANNWSNTKLSNTDGITFGGTLNISNSLRVNNSITGVNSIFLNTTSTASANGSVVAGQLTWNPDDKTVDVGTGESILQLGQEQYVRILNQSGETIYNANAVAYYGTVGNSGKLLGRRAIANNSYDSKNILGIATEDIPNGSEGFVTTYGKIRKIDTSMFSDGDILYVSSSIRGALQNTKPTAPNNKVQIGTVINSHAVNGLIFAAVQRGSSLADDELVSFGGDGGSITNGDLIRYVVANNRFENSDENAIGPAVNAIAAFVKANAAYTVANSSNGWSNTLASSGNTYSRYVANSANTYANNTFLPLTGGVVSGNITANNVIIGNDINVGRNLSIQGNLFVYGTTTTVSAANFTTSDNLLYLNQAQEATITFASGNGAYQTYTCNNNFTVGGVVRITGMTPTGYNTGGFTYVSVTSANSTSFSISGTEIGAYVSGGTAYYKAAINPDLGFSGGYNDGTYHHAGFFRDATDATFKVFEGYTLEPDAGVNIDTAHASFAFAKFQAEQVTANTFFVGTQNLQSTLHFAYNAANAAYGNANAGFVAANNWSNSVGSSVNSYASILSANIAAGANNYAGTLANSSNGWANTVSTAANNYATATYATQFSQLTGFASINSFASYVGTSTNNYTTATYATLTSLASNWAVTNAAYTSANGGIVALGSANSLWAVTNAAYTVANTARDSLASNWAVTNAAYTQANTAINNDASNWAVTNAAYTSANGGIVALGSANSLWAVSNASYLVANTARDSLASNWAVTNAAYSQANSKTFTFTQNTAPATANNDDLWVNSDTGVVYENFGNTTNPIWVEFGPTGVAVTSAPGTGSFSDITATGNVTVGKQVLVTYTPPGYTNAAVEISAANTKGGIGYADVIKLTNIVSGTPNPNKWIRINTLGGLEVVNSAYNMTCAILTDTGALTTTGAITPGAWTAGQVIKDTMLDNTQLSVLATTVATSTSDTDFISYSYTPVSTSSYLIIHMHVASYEAAASAGSGTDSYFSRIKVDGNEITYSKQYTRDTYTFRTGTLFPLTGRYTNSSTAAKTITVGVRRDTADDSITIVNSATALWMRITEIAR